MEKADKSMEIAKSRLEGSKEIMNFNKKILYHHIIVEAYTAMFHASRALLYKEGIQEKSHFAVYIYLKENYAGIIPINIINLLSIYRIERHDALYGLDYKPSKEDAIEAINDAEMFIAEIDKTIRIKKDKIK